MRLIRNSGRNVVLRPLTTAEAESVRRYCGAGMQTEQQDAQVVEALLAEMHNGKEPLYWLECDCRDTEAVDQRPRMTARIRGDGPRHFVRLAGRDAHSCPLQSFRTEPSEDEDDETRPGKHRPLRPIVNPLDYLDKEHEAGSQRPGGAIGRQQWIRQRPAYSAAWPNPLHRARAGGVRHDHDSGVGRDGQSEALVGTAGGLCGR